MSLATKILLVLIGLWSLPALMLTGFAFSESSIAYRVMGLSFVWLPHVLMVVSIILIRQGARSGYVTYLPLLPFAIFLAAQPIVLGWKMLGHFGLLPNSHHNSIVALEKALPPGTLTTQAKFYSLRTIKLSPEKTVQFLALEEPHRTVEDEFGNYAWNQGETGRKGVSLIVVEQGGGAPLIHRSGFIENGHLSENEFSNVGFFEGKKENGGVDFKFYLRNPYSVLDLSLDAANPGLVKVNAASASSYNPETKVSAEWKYAGAELGKPIRLEELDALLKKIHGQVPPGKIPPGK